MGGRGRLLVSAVLVSALLLAGCTAEAGSPGRSSAAPARGSVQPSAAGGSPCGQGSAAVANCLVALSFVSPEVGFGVYTPQDATDTSGPAQIVSTTDGGTSWRQVGRAPVAYGPASTRFPTLNFVGSTNGIEYGSGAAFATHDGGRNWAPVPASGRVVDSTSAGRRLWLTDTTCPMSPTNKPCTVGVEASTDAGHKWTALPLPYGPYLAAQTAVGPGGILIVAEWDNAQSVTNDPGVLLTSDDGGGSWQAAPLPCPTGYRFGGVLSLAPSSQAVWLTCAGQGSGGMRGVVLYRSTDLGATWTAESSFALGRPTTVPPGAPGGQIEALAARSATDAWVLEMNGGLVATTDGGRTWHDAMPSTMRRAIDGLFGTLAMVSTTHAYVAVCVTVAVAGFGGLWRTVDGGLAWHRLR